MAERRFAWSVYRALKERTAAFLKRGFAGQKLAEAASRVDQTMLSRYASTSPINADVFMPLDVLVDLIDASGETSLLGHLADLAGCLLVPLPQLDDAADAIDEHTIRSSEDYARMVGAIMSARRDGRLNADDKPRLLRDVRVLMVELAALAEAIKAVAK